MCVHATKVMLDTEATKAGDRQTTDSENRNTCTQPEVTTRSITVLNKKLIVQHKIYTPCVGHLIRAPACKLINHQPQLPAIVRVSGTL
jgi:hypothetical protein